MPWRLRFAWFSQIPHGRHRPRSMRSAPYGVQRGVTSEVTINGSNLAGNPRLVAPFGFRLDPPAKSVAKEDPSNWKLKLIVAADAAVGAYPIRVQTDDGISNPFLFVVGQLPQIARKRGQ